MVLGYVTLPKGLEVLIGLNPEGVTNLVDFNEYLQFFTRTLLVFGLAFEIPVFVVMLNLAGVVSGKQPGRAPTVDHRRHLRLRRDRDPVGRPVHDDLHGRADGHPLPHLRGHRPLANDRRKARRKPQRRASAPDELSPI